MLKRKLSNDSLWITLLKSFSQKSASWASSAVEKCDSKFGCHVIFKACLMYLLVRFSFTHKALWLVFVSISASQSGQSEMVSFFLPIRSQIVQESRIFSRFTFGILLIKPGVVLLTTQVTNETNPNFPSLYARCQTLICSSTDFCRVAAPFWAKSWAIYPIDTFLLKWLSCLPKSYHKLVQTQAL